jgi:sugar phosphate isomerase/epimerase
MRIGCCALSYEKYLRHQGWDLFRLMDVLADVGVDGLELTAYYFASTETNYLDRLKRRAWQLGLTISGAAVGGSFTSPQATEREAHIAMVKQWLGIANRLGAPFLRIFAGPAPKGVEPEQAFQWVVEGINACIPAAREAGVILALENHHGLTTTAAQVIRIVEAVGSPWLAVNLDTGNYRQVYDEIKATLPYAVTTHVKTTVMQPVGERIPVDTPQLLQVLHAGGYRGFLNIEYEEAEPAETAVPRFVRQLRAGLAALSAG